jgi:hypothetical protein
MKRLTLFSGQQYRETLDLSYLLSTGDKLADAVATISPGDHGVTATVENSPPYELTLSLDAHAPGGSYCADLIAWSDSGFHHRRSYRISVMEAPAPAPVDICLNAGDVRLFELQFSCRLTPGETLKSARTSEQPLGSFARAEIYDGQTVRLVAGARADTNQSGNLTLITNTSSGRNFTDRLRILVGGSCAA